MYRENAWKNYVKEVVARYKGKVHLFEVWNEPDGKWCWKHGPNGTEYGQFVIDTAKAIKEVNEISTEQIKQGDRLLIFKENMSIL